MANIDFSELKLKLMASIAAISAVKLLEAFMQVERESDRDLAWLIGLQMAIIVTGLLMAVAERLGHAPASAPPKP